MVVQAEVIGIESRVIARLSFGRAWGEGMISACIFPVLLSPGVRAEREALMIGDGLRLIQFCLTARGCTCTPPLLFQKVASLGLEGESSPENNEREEERLGWAGNNPRWGAIGCVPELPNWDVFGAHLVLELAVVWGWMDTPNVGANEWADAAASVAWHNRSLALFPPLLAAHPVPNTVHAVIDRALSMH
ncbi:hypothetical protein DL93DRAFT_2098255 [Clavulina sp. PMI_390]|nr:hypothetical protein DL93DRAFT_2098255 [Clavulina sp. PMI_390]